jgi:small subunit ribosomal protein S5
VQDVVAKSTGSQNPYAMIHATLDALQFQSSPRLVAQRRGKKVADILKKDDAPSVRGEQAPVVQEG